LTALPKWADTPTTKALLLDIVMEQPEARVGDASGFRVEEYRGRNALQLRRIFNDQLEGLSSAAADYWRATGRVNEALEDSITALLRQSDPMR
jgi:hypothetical protein